MNIQRFRLALYFLPLILLGCADPTAGDSAVGRGLTTGVGGLGGAEVANIASHGNPLAIAGGGLAGAAATTVALGPDQVAINQGIKEGRYAQAGDDAKSLYWARQRVEGANNSGKTYYYTFPAPTTTSDGTKTVPHDITVPVVQ